MYSISVVNCMVCVSIIYCIVCVTTVYFKFCVSNVHCMFWVCPVSVMYIAYFWCVLYQYCTLHVFGVSCISTVNCISEVRDVLCAFSVSTARPLSYTNINISLCSNLCLSDSGHNQSNNNSHFRGRA